MHIAFHFHEQLQWPLYKLLCSRCW